MTQFFEHWICKFCEQFNHETRTNCLSCDIKREDCELRDEGEISFLYEKINGKKRYGKTDHFQTTIKISKDS